VFLRLNRLYPVRSGIPGLTIGAWAIAICVVSNPGWIVVMVDLQNDGDGLHYALSHFDCSNDSAHSRHD
jgi:hypothetical protein